MAKYKQVTCTGTVESSIDDGICELEALQEEMDSWASGMEDTNLANSEKCQTVREAADSLESMSSDARRAFDSIQEEIRKLYDGVPEKPGCEKHELGKNCKRCSWSGKFPAAFKPAIAIYDPPREKEITRLRYSGDKREEIKSTILVFAEVQESQSCFYVYDSEHYEKDTAILAAQEQFDQEINSYNNTQQIPKEKPTIPAVEPVFPEDSDNPLEHEVTWTESRPYGRHVSRSSRLSAATEGMSAGVNNLREWLASYLANNQATSWTEEISDYLDEIDESISEAQNVEFPGMFG